jgi:hypothetical protein
VNNYLANIAARTFHLTPLVRPRLPGQFEAAPLQREGAVSRPEFGRREAMEAKLQESETESAAPVETEHRRAPNKRTARSWEGEPEPDHATASGSQPASRVVRVEAGPMSINALTGTDRPNGATADRLDPQLDAAAPKATLGERRAPEQTRVSAVREHPAGNVQRALGKHDEELGNPRPLVARLPAASAMEPQPVGVRQKAGPDDSARRNDNKPKPPSLTPIAPASQVIEVSDSPGRLPIMVQSRIVPRPEADGFGFNQKAKPSPEPTVHVTIGRIEVRAVQSSQPSPAKPRATPPVMNLDDYLRRRSNGGAR